MATLKDVAKLANVDVSTVSRALNNTSYVHPDTKERIYAAAKELLEKCPAEYVLVTFPTRTLGGRNVGMEEQYSAWMAENTPECLDTISRFTVDTELCYVLKRRDG